MENDILFSALANPIRRYVVSMLLVQDHSAGAIAERFAISRPTVSEHLGVLRHAGLVRERKVGRERIYSLNAEPLADLRNWLQPYEDYWKRHLEALARDIEETEE